MSGTVSQWQQSAFTTPVDGTTGTASVVLSNDNVTLAKHNAHDADATIHVQNSTHSARPAAGTAGRKWLESDTFRMFLDDGAAWNEVAYLPLAAGGTVTGTVNATAFVGPLTGAVTGNVTGNLTGNVTGNVSGTAATVTTAAQPAITSLGTLTGLTIAGTLTVTTNSGSGPGTIYKESTDGMVIVGASGSATDFVLYTPGGFAILQNPHGTRDVVIPGGAVTIATAQTSSAAYLNIGDGTAVEPTWGISSASLVKGIASSIASSASSGVVLNTHIQTKQTVANSGSVQGLESWTWASHTSGTVGSLFGLIGNTAVSGVGGAVTSVFCVTGGCVVSGGTVTNVTGINAAPGTVDGASSVVTNSYSLRVKAPIISNSGTVTNAYGVYIDSIANGGTLNYAIYCAGANDVVFNGSGSAVSTSATVGFVYLPSCAGTPTGTPTNTGTGRVPLVFDSTNKKIYIFAGGSWLQTAALV